MDREKRQLPSSLTSRIVSTWSFSREATTVNFKCPHCQHPSRVSQPKAGRFQPTCPQCKQLFVLVIDNAGKFQVQLPPSTEERKSADVARRTEHTPARSDESVSAGASQGNAAPASDGQSVDATSQIKGDATQQVTVVQTREMTPDSIGNSPGQSPPADETTIDKGPGSAGKMQTAGWHSATREVPEALLSSGDDSRPTSDRASEPSADDDAARNRIPKRLGGYRLERQLGKGGMGTVFLAKQISLDRQVAIKILKPSLTSNPAFVSRFVREAYAAAQLVHHNVVQIYDIGSQGEVHFFSMELVKGDSLAGVLKRQRRLDCDTAAGYILQAARGLKFAHDQGMVHRDVKPANLMLDEHGIVKVADLGLVKIGDEAADEKVAGQLGQRSARREGDSQITQFGVSVGTPTYMAPEQWKRSSEVDHRADIYSLGCTFYVLVTGKLPFDGKTPKEVVTKVISEQAVPPELLVKDIPKRISLIVNRMIAKDPADRYADMGQLISDLEEYLGVSSTGAFSPSERHVEILEKCVRDFNQHPLAQLRMRIVQVGLGLALILFLGGLVFHPRFAMTVLGTVVMAGASYFTTRGLFEKTHLFSRTRDYLFSNQIGDWITMGVTAIVLAVLTALVLGTAGSLTMLILGPLLGMGLYFGLDRLLAAKRQPTLDEAEKLFKVLRLRGLNEDLLRQFVCRFSGNNWEEFFEELFGYPAKLTARNWLKSESGKSRRTFRWWRDPLIRWMDKRFDAREQKRQIQHFEKVETQKLLAQGVDKAEAKVRARNIARLMTENAEAWRQSQAAQVSMATRVQDQTVADPATAKRPTLSNLSRNLDEKLKNRGPRITLADRFHGTISFLIGPRTRFLVGVVLFGVCLWWMQFNGKVAALSDATFAQAIEIVFSQKAYSDEGQVLPEPTRPVPLPLVPDVVMNRLNSINHGVIGLVFIYAATIWGWGVTLPVVAGALIALTGTGWGLVPESGIWVLSPENVCLIVGVAVAVIGCQLFRPRTEEPL